MSEIIYLLGAGASFGTREQDRQGHKNFKTGVPIVSELEEAIDFYCNKIRPYVISFGDSRFAAKNKKLYDELIWLRNICRDEITIDTYAKKLSIRHDDKELLRLKKALSIFFCLFQNVKTRDKRYDAFWSIVSNDIGILPDNISILSWNYDFQIEYAMHEFEIEKTSDAHLLKSENITYRGLTTSFLNYSQSNFVKLNGTASFKSSCDNFPIDREKYNCEEFEKLLNGKNSNWESGMLFAWEEDKNFFDKILPLTDNTRSLIIIGYSLPDYNKTIDIELISNMKHLDTIIIQDKNPEVVELNLRNRLCGHSNKTNIKIIHHSNVDSFITPDFLAK